MEALLDRRLLGTLTQVAAGIAFLALVWILFRFAVGLRYAKVVREEARDAQPGRVVAEIPSAAGDVGFFVEEADAFGWPGGRLAKAEVVGVRLLLRGGAIGSFARPGVTLPPAGVTDEFEGRERWDVEVYCRDGSVVTVPCGTLREGVSRDVAARVFEAVRARL